MPSFCLWSSCPNLEPLLCADSFYLWSLYPYLECLAACKNQITSFNKSALPWLLSCLSCFPVFIPSFPCFSSLNVSHLNGPSSTGHIYPCKNNSFTKEKEILTFAAATAASTSSVEAKATLVITLMGTRSKID